MDSQSNVNNGDIVINSGVDLTGKEGYLVKLADQGSNPEVVLPTDEADEVQFVVIEGGGLDEDSVVRPLRDGDQIRIRANGTGNSADRLALATISTDAGKVEKLPADADTYFTVGLAEEDFADEQFVKVRVFKKEIVVSP